MELGKHWLRSRPKKKARASVGSAWHECQTHQLPACMDLSNNPLPLEARSTRTVGLRIKALRSWVILTPLPGLKAKERRLPWNCSHGCIVSRRCSNVGCWAPTKERWDQRIWTTILTNSPSDLTGG